jgi:hypothetical protein
MCVHTREKRENKGKRKTKVYNLHPFFFFISAILRFPRPLALPAPFRPFGARSFLSRLFYARRDIERVRVRACACALKYGKSGTDAAVKFHAAALKRIRMPDIRILSLLTHHSLDGTRGSAKTASFIIFILWPTISRLWLLLVSAPDNSDYRWLNARATREIPNASRGLLSASEARIFILSLFPSVAGRRDEGIEHRRLECRCNGQSVLPSWILQLL